MKTLNLFVSVIGIFIGTYLPVQAGNPENEKDVKTVIDSTSSAPLTTWSLTVNILDADKDCPAQDCDLIILVWGANSDCQAVSSTLLYSEPYLPGTSQYHLGGNTNYTFAYIEIYDLIGDCEYNQNTCCEPIGMNMVCDLYVCRE
jgi:hypothetical protein